VAEVVQGAMTYDVFNAAQQHHVAGRLSDAQTSYRAFLTENPTHAAAIHFLGLTEFQLGHNDAALELMNRAMQIEPNRADFHSNYGLLLATIGRVDDAVKSYRRALELNPDYAEAANNLGIALSALGNKEEAIEEYRRAIKLRASYPEAYNNLGSALQSLNRFDEAIASFERALQLKPEFSEAQNNLGNGLMDAGRFEQALDVYGKALAMPRKLPQSYYGLGNALRKLDRLDDALSAFTQAIQLRPDYGEAHTNLGEALLTAGRISEAVSALAKATELTPKNPTILYNYASALMQDGKYEPAKAMFHRALEQKPDYPEALSNLGNALLAQGATADALAVYDKAIAVHPDFALGHWNRSLALFLKGDWDNGWQEYEWRWKIDSFKLKRLTPPEKQWDGSDLNGRRILLYAEQGFGDAIQFFRYALLVSHRGGKVIVQAPSQLLRLFRQTPSVEVVGAGDPLPEFDVHYPLLSLPLLFKTTIDTIPALTPYLLANPELVEKWKERIPTDPGLIKVGFVWRGRSTPDAQRSIPSDLLTPLASVPNIWFVNLQVGQNAAPPPFALADWRSEMSDFADTAAVMANLDLILTIDSASAHLAGALGFRTWTMLKYVADWRWLKDRDDSPFYPTMRLFRQATPGDWTSVIERVATDLKQLAPMRNPPSTHC
jgi:tetratricopeptide (TPR) repeat protein